MQSTNRHIAQLYTYQRIKHLLGCVLLMLFLLGAGCSQAWGETNEPAPCPSHSSDSLINDSHNNLIPCSDQLFVIPTQTTVEAPSQSCRVAGRDNTSASGNSQNAGKSDLFCQRFFARCVLKHNRRLQHLSFARATDYYVYFLNVLRL